MEKRYQVFVSSTFEDLQDERKEVMQALLELDCIPSGMELFPASNDDQWSLIKKVIDDCDYYILIIGGRYGSMNAEGKSYTQMEFEYALDRGLPIISFLPKEPENIISKKCEKGGEEKTKLEDFKILAQKKMVKYWTTPQDLGSVVSRSIIKLIKDFPAVGWIRADSSNDEKAIKEILKLKHENEALKAELQSIATQAPKGSELLSQGEDSFEIHYKFEAIKASNTGIYRMNHSFTWNKIFAYIAPNMIDECLQDNLKQLLVELVKSYIMDHRKDEFGDYKNIRQVDIISEDFNLILVQLRALGLIKLSERKRAVRDATDYWTLTEYGDYIMTQLLAIKTY